MQDSNKSSGSLSNTKLLLIGAVIVIIVILLSVYSLHATKSKGGGQKNQSGTGTVNYTSTIPNPFNSSTSTLNINSIINATTSTIVNQSYNTTTSIPYQNYTTSTIYETLSNASYVLECNKPTRVYVGSAVACAGFEVELENISVSSGVTNVTVSVYYNETLSNITSMRLSSTSYNLTNFTVENVTLKLTTSSVGGFSNDTYQWATFDLNVSVVPPYNYIYCAGTQYGDSTAAYYGIVSSSGIFNWTPTTNYSIPLYGAGCNIYNSAIYCIGTEDTPYSELSYDAPISSSGIGIWTSSTPYPIALSGDGCSAYNGYIYCIGTATPVQSYTQGVTPGYFNQTYFAQISGYGSVIGQWFNTTSYPIPITGGSCNIDNGTAYCVGTVASGFSTNTYFAPVSSAGIGTWKATTSYPQSFAEGSCSTYNNYIYCIGGVYDAGLSYYAPLSKNGIGIWKQTTSYPSSSFSLAGCDAFNGYIYCIGNEFGASDYSSQGEISLSTAGGCNNSTYVQTGNGLDMRIDKSSLELYSIN